MSYDLPELDTATLRNWVTKLRSGEYTQAQSTLHPYKGGFCCLGVLCDMVSPEAWDTEAENDEGYIVNEGDEIYWIDPDADETLYGASHQRMSESSLPESLRDRLGLCDHEVDFLVELNDNLEYSFEQIADSIERYILNKENRTTSPLGSPENPLTRANQAKKEGIPTPAADDADLIAPF